LYSDELHVISVQEGTVNGAGAALDWLNERVGIDAHGTAIAMTRATAGAQPPLFVNGVGGVGSPYWDSKLPTHFVGEGTEELQVQAVLESVAFLVCRNVERMQAPEIPRRILASGGLAASLYLCECVASLSCLLVQRASLREATALGVAFLLAGQPSDWHPPAEFESIAARPDTALLVRYRRWCERMDDLVSGAIA
jgi:glycerol kinase